MGKPKCEVIMTMLFCVCLCVCVFFMQNLRVVQIFTRGRPLMIWGGAGEIKKKKTLMLLLQGKKPFSISPPPQIINGGLPKQFYQKSWMVLLMGNPTPENKWTVTNRSWFPVQPKTLIQHFPKWGGLLIFSWYPKMNRALGREVLWSQNPNFKEGKIQISCMTWTAYLQCLRWFGFNPQISNWACRAL